MAESKHVVLLGKEIAAARAVEEQRLASGNAASSPLDPAAHYSTEELDLSRLIPSGREEVIAKLVRGYATAKADERVKIRASLNLKDFYALIAFAKRSAARALRENDPEQLL